MGTEPHPMFVGKTPLELEQMDMQDLLAHKDRSVGYTMVLDEELLIRAILNGHDLETFPIRATLRYKEAWHKARRRKGLR